MSRLAPIFLRGMFIVLTVPALFLPFMQKARADDITLNAALGIGGRYRTGAWLPINVRITNAGLTPVHGQVQVLASPAAGQGEDVSTAVFARPVDVAGLGAAPQNITVYARNINPARDDITIRLVEGRERGDGRVLAKTEYLTSSRATGLSGIPIGDNNLFVVGFADDPAAFNYLHGQKWGWGLQHNADGFGAAVPSSTPPNVQVAGATPADLPDKEAGYDGVDAFLLRSDAPLDALTEAQVAALKGWVASGGLLIISGGSGSSSLSASSLAEMLPTHRRHVPALFDTGSYGAGTVVVADEDLAGKSFQAKSMVDAAIWPTLMSAGGKRPASLLGRIAAQEEDADGEARGRMLSNAVLRAPALDAPGVGVIALFLLAYMVLLVPVNYLVLKRLDKKEWAWGTIPLLVVLFAAGTYGVGYAAKGNSFFVNRVTIVETTADQSTAGVYSEIGLFSPRRASYDISLADPNALAAIPGVGADSTDRRHRTPGAHGQTQFVEDAQDSQWQNVAVNMWAMRAFDVQTTGDLGGGIHSTIAYAPDRKEILGTLTNHTRYDLSECAVLFAGRWQMVGDLPRDGRVTATLTTYPETGSNSHFEIPTGGSGDDGSGQGASQMQTRLRAGLADFARSIGRDETGEDGAVLPGYTAHPDEAVLIGWSSDKSPAGPSPRVNGRPIDENDASLIVVHIPVR